MQCSQNLTENCQALAVFTVLQVLIKMIAARIFEQHRRALEIVKLCSAVTVTP